MAHVSQSDASLAMHILSLVDLSVPFPRFHADASSAIAGGAARASALLQFMHHRRVNSAYHILCSSRPDHSSTTANIKALKSASRTCHMGQFLPLNESSSLKDMHSRLKRLWRSDEKKEGEDQLIKHRNLLSQLDSHIEQKLSWFTDAQKSQSPSWILCFGTLPDDDGSKRSAAEQKQIDTARQALAKSMEASRSSLIWIECNPKNYAALVEARSAPLDTKNKTEASVDASSDPAALYSDFFRDMNGNGRHGPSGSTLLGLPPARRVTMLTLDELVNDANPSTLLDLIFTQPISSNSKMIDLLQEGLKSALCDCWPEPGDDFDRVLSRTRTCDKDLWGGPQDNGPLLSSQAPFLATHGDAARQVSQQKENIGPNSSLPPAVAAMPAKAKASTQPPRGPRGPSLLRAAKEDIAGAGAPKAPAGSSKMLPPSTAMIGKKQSDRLPRAPSAPRPAPRPQRQLHHTADAMHALLIAEKIRADYMKGVLTELESTPHLSKEKKCWAPNWDSLFDLAEKAAEPSVRALLTCSTFSVKAALDGTQALRPKRPKVKSDAPPAIKEKTDEEPLSQADQSINASGFLAVGPPPPLPLAAASLIEKKKASASKAAEGLGENAALLPADEADMNSLASKKLIWTLLENRWFKHSSTEIYQAYPMATGSWNGQKMRYANLAYIPCLMLSCLCHLDVRLEGEQQVKDASYALKNTLDEMSFVANSIGGICVVFERYIAPKFASRLPVLMERMHLLLNGATLSDHTPDMRLSGNTTDGGGSSDDSDANDGEVGRRSSKGGGGASSRGFVTGSEAPGSGSVRGQGSQRGYGGMSSQPVTAADNQSAGSGRPPSQYHRHSALKLSTVNEEVDSAPKIVGGRLAPVVSKHFRSHMPGANKWRPTVAMDKKATSLPASLPPSQQQPVLLTGAAAKVSTAAPLPPPKVVAVKPGSKGVLPKKAAPRKVDLILGGSPDVVLGATPLVKKRDEALNAAGLGAGLIMDQGSILPLFGRVDNDPPLDYGGGTWLAPAGRKRITNRSDPPGLGGSLGGSLVGLGGLPRSTTLASNRGPSMLDMLLQQTQGPPAQLPGPLDESEQPPLPLDLGEQEVKEGACADASEEEEGGCDEDYSLHEAEDACSPCKNSGRSGNSQPAGSKLKPNAPVKSINLIGTNSAAATGDRARKMRREMLLNASTKALKPLLGLGNKVLGLPPGPREDEPQRSLPVKDVAEASGGSRIPLPYAAALPCIQAFGGSSSIPSLSRGLPVADAAQPLPPVAEQACYETGVVAPPPPPLGPEIVEASPLEASPLEASPLEASPLPPYGSTAPPGLVPATVTPLPNSDSHDPPKRSSSRIKAKCLEDRGNDPQSSNACVPSSIPPRSSRKASGGAKAARADPSPFNNAPMQPDAAAAAAAAAAAQEQFHPPHSSKGKSAKKSKLSFAQDFEATMGSLNGVGVEGKRLATARQAREGADGTVVQPSIEADVFAQSAATAPDIPSLVDAVDPLMAPSLLFHPLPNEGDLGSQSKRPKRKRGGGKKAKAVTSAVVEGGALSAVPEEIEEEQAVKGRGGRRAKLDPVAIRVNPEAPAPAPAPLPTGRVTRRQASQQLIESGAVVLVAGTEVTSVLKRGRAKAELAQEEEEEAAGVPRKKRGRGPQATSAVEAEACDTWAATRKSVRSRRKSCKLVCN